MFGEEAIGVKPLHHLPLSQIQQVLPPNTNLLNDPCAIEQYLRELDGAPPDWVTLHGQGHGDPTYDERLFRLNRERDVRRVGNAALNRVIAFVWSGVLSTYDPDSTGFHVVLGPRFTETTWGLVRFKYEDLFGNLIAIPPPEQSRAIREEIGRGRSPDIDVVMLGTLVPEESIVYDFSHDEEGRGVVMPVVRIRDIVYLYQTSSETVP